MIVSKGPEYFEIPEIIDLPVDEALAELEAMGLKAEVDEEHPWDEKIAEDHVISVSPEVGSEVTRRDEITLTISAGREPMDVPLTVNMTRKDAVSAIEAADLKPEIRSEEHTSELQSRGH